MADKGADITANDTNNQVHAATFAFTTHNAVGNVAYQDACENRPGRKICYMF
jgi:hypothetical protein